MANAEHLAILRQGVEVWNAWWRKNPPIRPDLRGANLPRTNLSGVILIGSNLSGVILIGANLTSANLYGADFYGAKLFGTNLTDATVGRTRFDNLDLRTIHGLDTIRHEGPSTIGIDTLYRSQGQIPEIFLRGCGVPDSMIKYTRSLVAAERPIDYYSCFISYSSQDEAIAQRLHADLQARGVRCWFAPHDLEIGEVITTP